MGDKTGIEWTDASWNPIRGCSRISQGCVNCYAEKVAARFSGPGHAYEGLVDDKGRWNGQVRVVPERMLDPMRWRRGRKIFVNSMSDLFHESMGFRGVAEIFGVMACAPQHTFQVLTKRANMMRLWVAELEEMAQAAGGCNPAEICCDILFEHQWGRAVETGQPLPAVAAVTRKPEQKANRPAWPLPNVWMGVSVEDERVAHRVDHLRATPAAVRWLSVEPLIGPLDLRGRLDGIHWAVIGGESGVGARPCRDEWVTDIVHACQAAGVAVFMKQVGAKWQGPGSITHHKGGEMAEWPEALRVREFPAGVA